MSISPATTQQVHTVLGGGIRYETAELVLLTIPNFELKQKGRILHLFAEVRSMRMHSFKKFKMHWMNNRIISIVLLLIRKRIFHQDNHLRLKHKLIRIRSR